MNHVKSVVTTLFQTEGAVEYLGERNFQELARTTPPVVPGPGWGEPFTQRATRVEAEEARRLLSRPAPYRSAVQARRRPPADRT